MVAGKGYHDATVTGICAAAGVSRRTFYSYFSSKQDCVLRVFDDVLDFLIGAVEDAAPEEAGWPMKVRARIAALLELLAANPDLVRFLLLAPIRAGDTIADHHRTRLSSLLDCLLDGIDGYPQAERPSPAIEQALLGGMVALMGKRAEEGEGGKLPGLLPDLVELVLTPYVGRAEAERASVAGKSYSEPQR